MTYQNQPPAGYQPPPPPPPGYQEQPKRRGLATAALVLGIIGLILAVIPFANFVAYPLVILAIIFGILARQWGKAKAGLILGVLGLIATIAWTVGIGYLVDDAVNTEHTVAYSATGSGKAAISYAQYTADGNTSQETNAEQVLPFSKTFKVKGSFSAYAIAVANTTGTGQIGCSVSVDGKVVSQKTASGANGTVTCQGSGYDGD